MPIKRMTANRDLILYLLDATLPDCGFFPPYPASSLLYELNNMHRAGMLHKPPNRRQLFRTLSDLWHDGIIVASRQRNEACANTLPYWELCYELSTSSHRNGIRAQCAALHRAVSRAKFGVKFFGATFDLGATPEQIAAWRKQARTLAQQTHPDKVDGFIEQFHLIAECLEWLRDIPPPDNLRDAPPKSIARNT